MDTIHIYESEPSKFFTIINQDSCMLDEIDDLPERPDTIDEEPLQNVVNALEYYTDKTINRDLPIFVGYFNDLYGDVDWPDDYFAVSQHDDSIYWATNVNIHWYVDVRLVETY